MRNADNSFKVMQDLASEAESWPLCIDDKYNQEDVDIYIQGFLHIARHKNDFRATRHGLSAIRALRIAWTYRISVPMWVQSWLNDGFSQYVDSLQTESLEDCFGLKSEKKNSPKTDLEREKIASDNFAHIFECFKIKFVFGVSGKTACAIYIDKVGDGMLSEDTLSKYFSKNPTVKRLKKWDDFEQECLPTLYNKLEIVKQYTPTDALTDSDAEKIVRSIVEKKLGKNIPVTEMNHFVNTWITKKGKHLT